MHASMHGMSVRASVDVLACMLHAARARLTRSRFLAVSRLQKSAEDVAASGRELTAPQLQDKMQDLDVVLAAGGGRM